VANSVGYASASDLRLHFGLGQEQKATLEIFWPSGIRQNIKDISVNQCMEVIEPGSPPRTIK
jgi:hypothetical protein